MDNSKITDEVFESLLYISRLSVDGDEKEKLSGQIASLVEHLQELDAFVDKDLDCYVATNGENDLRSNEVGAAIEAGSLKKMSDEYMDGYFRVPKVLDN